MKCSVCGSKNNKVLSSNIYKCDNCSHIFIDYQGDGLDYHKNEYRNNNHGVRGSEEIHENKFTEKFHKLRESICRKRMYAIEPLLSQCNSLLDIGAGGGTFLNAVKSKINNLEAQEISDLCALNLELNGYKVHHGNFNTINFDKKYDLVTCWHVLEHIRDLHSFAKKASEVTKKFLVIEVPVKRQLKDPGSNWDGHFHYFSTKSIEILFEKYFNIISIQEGVQSPALLCLLNVKQETI